MKLVEELSIKKLSYDPRLKFPVIETTKRLAMGVRGSGCCEDHEILAKWLRWRISDGWVEGNKYWIEYDQAVRSLAVIVLKEYDDLIQKMSKLQFPKYK